MKYAWLSVAMLTALILCEAGCTATPTAKAPRPGPDLSSPKAAATSFYTAMKRGDSDTAKATIAEVDQPCAVWIATLCEVMTAKIDLRKQLVSRFGAGADDFLNGSMGIDGDGWDQALFSLQSTVERIDGDSATMDSAKFVRKDGQWKLIIPADELAKTTLFSGPGWIRHEKRVTIIYGNLARELANGKYATLDHATDAFFTKVTGPTYKP